MYFSKVFTFCWHFGEVVHNMFNFSGWLTTMCKWPWVRNGILFKNVLCLLLVQLVDIFLQPVALYFTKARLIFLLL